MRPDLRPLTTSSRTGFGWPFVGSAAIHAVLLAGALVLMPALAPSAATAPRVWLSEATVDGETLALAADSVEALPEVTLPEVADPLPEPADEAFDEPRLEPLEATVTAPARDDLSPALLDLRTKPRDPPPTPVVPPPPTVRPPPVRTRSSAASAAAAPVSAPAPLRLVYAPAFGAADYPAEARRSGHEGTTLVRITIATSGEVVDARLLVSSGSPLLDADAVQKARLYRFAPIPSSRVENLPVRYRLD